MAMTKCRECGNQISTTAEACPKCGAKVLKRSNTGIVILGFVAILVIANMARSCDESAKREAAQKAAQETAQLNAMLTQQQTDAFNKQREQVLAVTRAALDKGDLEAAALALAPLDRVNDLDLEPLRKALKDKKQAASDAAEKARLIEEAKALKRGDAINGSRIYDRLLQLEPLNADYAAKAAAFQKINQQEAAKAVAEEKREARKRIARNAEEAYLKKGLSATITTEGKDGTVLRIKFVFVSKAFAYQIQHQDDFIATCREAGFKKIVMYDGYNETWTLTL